MVGNLPDDRMSGRSVGEAGMNQIQPNDIIPASGGPEWMALKAAALSLQIKTNDHRSQLRFWRGLSAVLAMLLVGVVACWRPAFVLDAMVVGISLLALSAIFVVTTSIPVIMRQRRRNPA
jgi:hypothetical protein